jgi:hypothetical protein
MKSHKNTKKNTKKNSKKINKNTKKINKKNKKNTKKIKGGSGGKIASKIASKIAGRFSKLLSKKPGTSTYISLNQMNSTKPPSIYETASEGEYSPLNTIVYEQIPASANSVYETIDGYYNVNTNEPIYEEINNRLLYSTPQNAIREHSGVHNNPQTRKGQEYITWDPLYNMASSSSSSTNGPIYSLASGNKLSQESNNSNNPYANKRKVLGRTPNYNIPQFVYQKNMNNPTYNPATIPTKRIN